MHIGAVSVHHQEILINALEIRIIKITAVKSKIEVIIFLPSDQIWAGTGKPAVTTWVNVWDSTSISWYWINKHYLIPVMLRCQTGCVDSGYSSSPNKKSICISICGSWGSYPTCLCSHANLWKRIKFNQSDVTSDWSLFLIIYHHPCTFCSSWQSLQLSVMDD